MELLTAVDGSKITAEGENSVASAIVPAGLVINSEALLTGLRAMEVVKQLKRWQNNSQILPLSIAVPREVSLAARGVTTQLAIEYREEVENNQQLSQKGRKRLTSISQRGNENMGDSDTDSCQAASSLMSGPDIISCEAKKLRLEEEETLWNEAVMGDLLASWSPPVVGEKVTESDHVPRGKRARKLRVSSKCIKDPPSSLSSEVEDIKEC